MPASYDRWLALDPRPEKASARPAGVVASGRPTLGLPGSYAATLMGNKRTGRWRQGS